MLTKQDWVIGAVWKMARRGDSTKAAIIGLLVTRAKLPAAKATQLCEGWLAHSLKAQVQP